MFKSVTMINANRESLTLPIRDAYKTGYNVVDITGITPADADIKLSTVNSIDGSFYNGYHKSHRTIVATFKYMYPNALEVSIEKLRHDMYRLCRIGSKMTLVFETGQKGFEGYRKCKIEGIVKSNEGHIFDEHEGCSIAFECPDPWFQNADDSAITTFKPLSVKPLFEFQSMDDAGPKGYFPSRKDQKYNAEGYYSPGDNSINDKNEFANIKESSGIKFTYNGEGAPGVVMMIHLSPEIADLPALKIVNKVTNQSMSLNMSVVKKLTQTDLRSGYIEISTQQGDKYVNFNNGTKVFSLIPALARTSNWLIVTPGYNEFYIPIAGSLNYSDFSLTYKDLYDGV